jgi:hypothetical protein
LKGILGKVAKIEPHWRNGNCYKFVNRMGEPGSQTVSQDRTPVVPDEIGWNPNNVLQETSKILRKSIKGIIPSRRGTAGRVTAEPGEVKGSPPREDQGKEGLEEVWGIGETMKKNDRPSLPRRIKIGEGGPGDLPALQRKPGGK